MGKRTSFEPGTFSWVELATTDPEAAKGFYGAVFGWGAEDAPAGGGGTYTTLQLGEDAVAGMMEQPAAQRDAGVPPNWFSYVTVASADEVAGRVDGLGGSVHAPPFDVLEHGRMAVIADPTGAHFGIWEPRASIGAERVNDPGCLTMNELSTNDTAAAEAFYGGLLGWRFEAIDTGDAPPYWSIRHEGAAGGLNGGMRELAPEQAGAPPHWMPYFTVESADDAVERAVQAGGTLMFGPLEIPAGRFAVLTDPKARSSRSSRARWTTDRSRAAGGAAQPRPSPIWIGLGQRGRGIPLLWLLNRANPVLGERPSSSAWTGPGSPAGVWPRRPACWADWP